MSIYQCIPIFLAVVQVDILLYSAGPRLETKMFLAFAFFFKANRSSGVNSLVTFLTCTPSTIFTGIVGPSVSLSYNS